MIGSRTRLKPISTRHARMLVWMGLTDLIREKLRTVFWSLREGSFFLYKCEKAWGVVSLGSHLARRKKDSLRGINSRRGQRWGYSKEGGRAWKTMPEAYVPLRFSFMWVKGSSLMYKVSLLNLQRWTSQLIIRCLGEVEVYHSYYPKLLVYSPSQYDKTTQKSIHEKNVYIWLIKFFKRI